MYQDPPPADEAHAMNTVFRCQQPAGRFGRDVRDADAQLTDPRTTMQTNSDGTGFETTMYAVDADAVAEAIVSRLLAGRTFPPPPAEPR
jgi:hypothetical protein